MLTALGILLRTVPAAVLAGFVLDCLLGDPHDFPHPVRGIGFLISRGERFLRRCLPGTPLGERAGGALLALWVVSVSTALPLLLLLVCARVSAALCFFVQSALCYQIFAARSLRDESMAVYNRLQAADLPDARRAVSMIVGRDTENLSAPQVAKAAVETVAENLSDGVIAPLIFMLLGGAPLGLCYKAVNTMDSMIGYKNEKYLHFGRCAARLDDLLNLLPARLSAVLMVCAAPLCGLNGRRAYAVWRRDHAKHPSPNSAHTEAACAGALGIQLAGDAVYFGVLHRKQTLGDFLRPVEIEDIRRANRLMYASTLLGLLLLCGARLCLLLI